jgi:hypothetical protein
MFSNNTPHHDAMSTHSFCVLTAHFPIQHCKQNPTVFQDVRFQPSECHHNVKAWMMSLLLEHPLNGEKWKIMLTTVLDIRTCHIMVRILLTSWEVNGISPSQKIPCIAWNQKVQYSSQEQITCPILSWINEVHAFSTNFFKTHLNIILQSMPRPDLIAQIIFGNWYRS